MLIRPLTFKKRSWNVILDLKCWKEPRKFAWNLYVKCILTGILSSSKIWREKTSNDLKRIQLIFLKGPIVRVLNRPEMNLNKIRPKRHNLSFFFQNDKVLKLLATIFIYVWKVWSDLSWLRTEINLHIHQCCPYFRLRSNHHPHHHFDQGDDFFGNSVHPFWEEIENLTWNHETDGILIF